MSLRRFLVDEIISRYQSSEPEALNAANRILSNPNWPSRSENSLLVDRAQQARDLFLQQVANNVQVPSTVPRLGPSIPNISRPPTETSPFDYLTRPLRSIIYAEVGFEYINPNRARHLWKEGFFDFLALPRSLGEFFNSKDQDAYLLFQAGLRQIDFTRSPYGYLSLPKILDLMYIILYRLIYITNSPQVLFLAFKHLYPDLDADVYTLDQIKAKLTADDATLVVNPKLRARKDLFRFLPRDILEVAFELYIISPTDPSTEFWQLINQTPIELADTFILALAADEINDIIEGLGIVVPPNRTDRDYVMANLPAYRDLLINPPDQQVIDLVKRGDLSQISRLTDRDLFSILDVYVYYDSRAGLIHRLHQLKHHAGFFIPLHRACANTETYYTTLTNDYTVPLIAYGTYQSYHCYEQDELITITRRGPLGPIIDLSNRVIRDRYVIEDLVALARNYGGFDSLVNHLTQLLVTKTITDPELVDQLRQLTLSEQQSIRDLLLLFFKTGMYMRRWTGTGCYPVTEAQTLTDIDPMPLSDAGMMQIRDHYDNMSPRARQFMDLLILYNPNGPSPYSLMERYEAVATGESSESVVDTCIRVNSSKFILTAVHYLDLLFGYHIPDFNPRDLESIT